MSIIHPKIIKKTLRFLFILLLLPSLNSCKELKTPSVQFETIHSSFIGTWYNEKTETYEYWKMVNGQYTGRSFKIIDSDTIDSEKLRLLKIDNVLYYEATVMNQNEGNSILFKQIMATKDRVIFENSMHDFPQKIIYQFHDNGQLVVTISGEIDELENEFTFDYKKVVD